jgi:hypothetical protein
MEQRQKAVELPLPHSKAGCAGMQGATSNPAHKLRLVAAPLPCDIRSDSGCFFGLPLQRDYEIE